MEDYKDLIFDDEDIGKVDPADLIGVMSLAGIKASKEDIETSDTYEWYRKQLEKTTADRNGLSDIGQSILDFFKGLGNGIDEAFDWLYWLIVGLVILFFIKLLS